jgi:general secretion pathway protein C
MTTWQSPSSRPLSIHNLVLGVAIGLAILCAAITLVVVLERQQSAPGLGSAIARLDEARDDLNRSAEALREATTALQAATRAPTTINIMDLPPAAAPALPAPDAIADSPTRYCPEPGRCTLPRKVLEEALANPSSVASQARVMPSKKDGVIRGFKFYAIRPDSLPRDLGFKNYDLLKRINGLPLGTQDQALEAYAKLRRSDKLLLEIERDGQPLVKEITIE